MQIRSLGQEGPLQEGMATYSGILTWNIPWTEELGGLWPIGLQSLTRLKQLRTHGEESQLQSPNRKSETQRKEIVSTRSIHRGMSQPKSSWGTFALSRWGNCLPVGLSFLICAVGLCVFEGRQLYHIAPGWSLSSQPP